MLRFVLGCESFPAHEFFAADAPQFVADPQVVLRRFGSRIALEHAGSGILTGVARHEPFGVTVDVGDAAVHGFGAATGAPTRNGARFRVMTRDTLLFGIPGSSYTALPFFLMRSPVRTVGVLVATGYPLDVVVEGGTVQVTAACDTAGEPLDVVVLTGTPAEIVRDLASLTGRSCLPPAWALGFHQSRWSYRSQRAVLDVAHRFRALDLPADVVHLDIDYMDRYRVFTWHPRRFPRPQQLHEELHTLGFRSLAIVDPGVSAVPYPAFDTLRAGDMLLTRADGEPYRGKVWPGATVFPDFTLPHVREAWGRLHGPLLAAGVGGFWIDMNDPVFRAGEVYDPLAEDVQHHGVPHRRVRNQYANGMAQATVSGLVAARPDQRPFVLSRSGFLGIQRHAAVWTGDNHSSWQHLRENLHMVLNLGLSGVPVTGADIGGFGRGPGKFGLLKLRRPSAELFVRWMELGALMPFFRVHCTKYAPRQEPWSFGPRALDLSRLVLRRRYRLLPLLYRLALEAHCDGLPLVRPLFMHCDHVPPGVGDDQFLLGPDLLVAPVLAPGVRRRQVWLPPGSWVDWHDGTRIAGDRRIDVDAPLGRTPLFVRAGAALFTARPGRNAAETLAGPLALEVCRPNDGTVGRGRLFLDDGESAYGRRFLLDVVVEADGPRLRVRLDCALATHQPVQDAIELRVADLGTSALVDGVPATLDQRSLAGEDRPRTVRAVSLPLTAREIVVE
jgi:alpha-glucosidase